jgi:uncharacterized membrane protein (DUF485 family)
VTADRSARLGRHSAQPPTVIRPVPAVDPYGAGHRFRLSRVVTQLATQLPASAPPNTPDNSYVEAEQWPEFGHLRRALRRFVFPTTVAFLLWYGLYVVLSAYARNFMGTKVVGNINVALIFGLLQFLTTFLIAWAYVRYADRRLDPLAAELRERLEGGERQ